MQWRTIYLISYISLADAVTILEEVNIDRDEIRRPRSGEEQEHAIALLTHAALSTKSFISITVMNSGTKQFQILLSSLYFDASLGIAHIINVYTMLVLN